MSRLSRTLRLLALGLMVALLAACVAAPVANNGGEAAEAPAVVESDSPEAVISGVEDGAELVMWTWFLSPTFDEYIQGTIARFEEAYPGVTVTWEDQTDLPDKYRNSLAAGNAPDVINLSSGWVPEFAQAEQLVNMSEALPADVQDDYFSGLFNVYNVDGDSYQVPWYQALTLLMYNGDILEAAGLTEEDMPTNYEELRAVCETIKEETGNYCTAPNLLEGGNLLNTLAYNGVQILSDDGSEVIFNSPEGAETLQFWADMLADDLIPRDSVTLEHQRMIERFSAGEFAFILTGPQLIRLIEENNPDLYENLGVTLPYTGSTGAMPPSSMGMAVTANTEFPNAALALAVFMTNAQSQLEFAQEVSVYPANEVSYEDPFFSEPGETVEDVGRNIAFDIISTQENLVPTLPEQAEANEILRNNAQAVLLGQVTAQEALDAAAQEINAMMQ